MLRGSAQSATMVPEVALVSMQCLLSFRQMRDSGFCFCNMEIAFSLILAHLALLSTYMLYTNWLLVPGVAMRYVGNC
jgi:hypothetical protein